MSSSDYTTNIRSSTKKRNKGDDLDYLIKDALLGTVRRSDSQLQAGDQRTWATVLQRAQTEVIQLPPTDDSAPSEPTALKAVPATDSVEQPCELFTVLTTETGIPYNFSAQVNYYRSLVDMKIWCSVGTLKLLGNGL